MLSSYPKEIASNRVNTLWAPLRIVAPGRLILFGSVVDGEMRISDAGKIVRLVLDGVRGRCPGGDSELSLRLGGCMSCCFAICGRGWIVNDDFDVAPEGGQQAEETLDGVLAEVAAQETR